MSQILRLHFLVRQIDSETGAQQVFLQKPSLEVTRTNTLAAGGGALVTTTAAAIPLGGVSSPGWATFENLDGTNYVSIGWDEAGTFREAFRLGPRESTPVPLSPLRTWQWKANGDVCQVLYTITQRNA